MEKDLTNWKGCPPPEWKVMEGTWVRLEPLDQKHADDLYAISSGEEGERRLQYLWEEAGSREDFQTWLSSAITNKNILTYAIVDKKSGRTAGRVDYRNINTTHGTAEIGGVLFGPLISRKAAATEVVYLLGRHVFDDLGYRRFEWKCHPENEASRKAALRFGFVYEGHFRQQYVMKRKSRGSYWFSIIDKEWPALKKAYENWLDPNNFDALGVQKKKLEDFKLESGV